MISGRSQWLDCIRPLLKAHTLNLLFANISLDAAEEKNHGAAGQEDQSLQDETAASSPQRRLWPLKSLHLY